MLKCATLCCPEGFTPKDTAMPEMYESDGRRFSRDIVVINEVAHAQWLVRQREKDELDHAEQQRLKGLTAALEGRRAAQLQKDLAAERAAHAHTKAMLHDLAAENLPEWMAEVVTNREELMQMLSLGASSDDNDNGCDGSRYGHTRNCQWGLWLRRIGGAEEVQRQVEAAHEWYLEEMATAQRPASRANDMVDSLSYMHLERMRALYPGMWDEFGNAIPAVPVGAEPRPAYRMWELGERVRVHVDSDSARLYVAAARSEEFIETAFDNFQNIGASLIIESPNYTVEARIESVHETPHTWRVERVYFSHPGI